MDDPTKSSSPADCAASIGPADNSVKIEVISEKFLRSIGSLTCMIPHDQLPKNLVP